jgi:hypothetical protein
MKAKESWRSRSLRRTRCWRRSATRRPCATTTRRVSASLWRCTLIPSLLWRVRASPPTCWRRVVWCSNRPVSATTTSSTRCAAVLAPPRSLVGSWKTWRPTTISVRVAASPSMGYVWLWFGSTATLRRWFCFCVRFVSARSPLSTNLDVLFANSPLSLCLCVGDPCVVACVSSSVCMCVCVCVCMCVCLYSLSLSVCMYVCVCVHMRW